MCLAFIRTMRKSSVNLERDTAEGHDALLTLRRGVSALGAWAFDAPDAGLTIAVGPGPVCDWQIASPGVSPFFLAFTGDALLVRAIRLDGRLRLNGQILADTWVGLSHGDMIDLGSSTLAVRLGPALRPKGTSRSDRRKQKKASAAHRAHARQDASATQERIARENKEARTAARGTALSLRDDFSRNAPVLFQEHDPDSTPPQATLMWYAAMAFGTLLAYLA